MGTGVAQARPAIRYSTRTTAGRLLQSVQTVGAATDPGLPRLPGFGTLGVRLVGSEQAK